MLWEPDSFHSCGLRQADGARSSFSPRLDSMSGCEEEKRMLAETGGRVTALLWHRFGSFCFGLEPIGQLTHGGTGAAETASEKSICAGELFDPLMMHS